MKNQEKIEIEWEQVLSMLRQAFHDGLENEVLHLFLSFDERQGLKTRLHIIKELLRGELTQRELKDQLQTGIATITRGSNSLKEASPELKKWLFAQLLQNEQKQNK